jgi:hypothetical protein
VISPRGAWGVLRKLEALLDLEDKHGRAIAGLQDQIDTLADRVTRLETRDEVLIAKAEAAAGMTAMGAATAAMSDLSRRVGGLETRAQIADAPEATQRLPKPRSKPKPKA